MQVELAFATKNKIPPFSAVSVLAFSCPLQPLLSCCQLYTQFLGGSSSSAAHFKEFFPHSLRANTFSNKTVKNCSNMLRRRIVVFCNHSFNVTQSHLNRLQFLSFSNLLPSQSVCRTVHHQFITETKHHGLKTFLYSYLRPTISRSPCPAHFVFARRDINSESAQRRHCSKQWCLLQADTRGFL